MFDYLTNLVTTNPDGTVTIGGVTYATDGSGIIENYGGSTQDGATSGAVFDSDVAAMLSSPFGDDNAFMVDGEYVEGGAPDAFSQALINSGLEDSGTDSGGENQGSGADSGGADGSGTDSGSGTDNSGSGSDSGSGSGNNNNNNVDESIINAIDIFKSNTDLSGNALSQISGLTDNLRIGLQDAQVTQNADGTFLVTTRDGSVIQYQPDGSNPVLISDTNYDNSSLASSIMADPNSENYGSVTIDDLADYLTAGGLGSGAIFLREGSATPEEIAARYLVGDRLTGFQDLMKNFDRSTIPEFTGNYTYNPNNPGFGAGTGRNQVFYVNPLTGNISMGLASEVSAQFPGITTYNSALDATVANPDITTTNMGSSSNATTNNTTTNNTTGSVNYEQLYNNLLAQQNQPSSQTGLGDMSGLMGLINQFMQSRNSLQGAGRYNNMYGSMYGGGMGYGNPFNSGMGYGYGMNPYAGGIGSFYGNTGLGFSPSGYNSGYGSGYGMNNMFYGGFGGNNYNQMAYNPYSSLYNQLSNPQTYGYSGDIYTPEYSSYLNTPFEGSRYSQGYQDYLQQNNPGVYTNLFGGAV